MATESWKLHTSNENVRPPVKTCSEHPSRDAAISAACDELKKSHVKAEFIEGPHGEKIDKDAIERLYRSHQAP
jgi:hypothetical protein